MQLYTLETNRILMSKNTHQFLKLYKKSDQTPPCIIKESLKTICDTPKKSASSQLILSFTNFKSF